ncbi:LOW QUALITY PROTEIN: HLH domain-containing protein, partial [Cephalotus follicularis]
MDDYNFSHECHINSLANFTTQNMATTLEGNFQQSFSHESHSSHPTTYSGFSLETCQTSLERPTKFLKSNMNWKSSITTSCGKKSSSPSSQIHSFGNLDLLPDNFKKFHGYLDCSIEPKDEAASPGNRHDGLSQGAYENINYEPKTSQGTKRPYMMTRTPSNAQYHILAERKLREKLSQHFIALSAIVPGLKKTDKASVLGDAIKYLKQLQERVKKLEEQTTKKTMESVVFVKKCHVSADEEISSVDENFDRHKEQPLPDIEARVADKNVLIRIHCEKSKGCIVKVLCEVEKLHLTVVNSCVVPFGDVTLDITVVAQMDNEFSMTLKDLVRNLRQALLK